MRRINRNFSHKNKSPVCLKFQEKEREKYLYSAILVRTHTLKALRHGSHSFTCKRYTPCLPFLRKRSPDGAAPN